MARKSIEKLITIWRARYHKVNRKEKTKILDEFVALTGYHRKAAIRALGRKPRSKGRRVVDPEGVGHSCGQSAQNKPVSDPGDVLWKRFRKQSQTLLRCNPEENHRGELPTGEK